MDNNKFVSNFADQFEETDRSVFNMNTRFRDIEEWSSLVHLSIIIMLDQEYEIAIDEEVFEKLNTIEDIYNYINK